MNRYLQASMLGFVFVALIAPAASSQETSGARQRNPPSPEVADNRIPLKVQIVISRHQDAKQISSLPYLLSVNANEDRPSQLRMGAQVPVPTLAHPVIDGKQLPASGPVQYHNIGTHIDCFATSLDGGRFSLRLSIEDTTVYAPDASAGVQPGGQPTFRSFRSENSLILKDGQSAQFTTAADRISGEIVKVDVTLTVMK